MAQASLTNGHDATAWVHRWDRQQELYLPEREEVFSYMFDVLERLDARPGRLLDLACGPGSLAERTLARYSDAEVEALDFDPVVLALGRAHLGDRVRWIDADLRQPDWTDHFARGSFEAIVTSTALHWLESDQLTDLTRGINRLLRPGGVFLNYDTLAGGPETPRLTALMQETGQQEWAMRAGESGVENFATWWERLTEAELGWQDLFAVRQRRLEGRHAGDGTTFDEWRDALRGAGFGEAGVLMQRWDRRLLAAIR